MSIQHVAAVLDSRRPDLSGTRKLVLITLANRTDTRGICWPSQDLIAGECGVSLRAVSDHLKALDDAGYITRKTKHLGQGNGSRTTYSIHLEMLSDTPKNGNEQSDIEPEEFAHAEFAHAKTVVCTGSTPRVTNLQEPTDTILVTREREKPDVNYSLMVRERIMAAAGLDDVSIASSPRLIAPTEIIHLLKPVSGEPCDLELDVLPAVQVCAAQLAARGQSLKSWSYCREAIIRNRDQRLTAAPDVKASPSYSGYDGSGHSPRASRKPSGGGLAATALRVVAENRGYGK